MTLDWRLAVVGAAVVCGLALGGYFLGKQAAPDVSDAETEREGAYELAAQEAEAESNEESRAQGLSAGLKEGKAKGKITGRQEGQSAGEQEAAERIEAAQPVVESCTSTGFEPNLANLVVTDMTCEAAQAVMGQFAGISESFVADGFSCTQTSGVPLGGSFSCMQGEQSFTFDFGD
jgi:hypothetical protein